MQIDRLDKEEKFKGWPKFASLTGRLEPDHDLKRSNPKDLAGAGKGRNVKGLEQFVLFASILKKFKVRGDVFVNQENSQIHGSYN